MRERRILVVEDEYIVAQDLSRWLQRRGLQVIGPAPRLERARALIASEAIDAALLDIHLRGELVFPAAEDLAARCIPFVFLSGFGRSIVPDRFAHIRLLDKPVSFDVLSADLEQLLGA